MNILDKMRRVKYSKFFSIRERVDKRICVRLDLTISEWLSVRLIGDIPKYVLNVDIQDGKVISISRKQKRGIDRYVSPFGLQESASGHKTIVNMYGVVVREIKNNKWNGKLYEYT